MLNFFLTVEDGYASLKPAGVVAVYVLIALTPLLILLLSRKRGRKLTTKELVFSAVAIALGFALSYVKILRMPWGGAATLMSMLMITLIGYWYGARIGFAAAFAYSLLQFVQGGGSYMVSILQVCFDYFFAFTALGVSGFFRKGRYGMQIGYLVAVILRGLFHTLGGYFFWMDYMPDSFPKGLAFAYPVVYNYSYILIEAALTLVLISLPAVQNALQEVKKIAVEE